MSSSSVDSDGGGDEDTITEDRKVGEYTNTIKEDATWTHRAGGHIAELLQEERDAAPTPEQLGNGISRYKRISHIDDVSEDGSAEALPRRAESPIDSIPDDSPSVQVIISNPLFPLLLTPCHRALSYLLLAEAAYYYHL